LRDRTLPIHLKESGEGRHGAMVGALAGWVKGVLRAAVVPGIFSLVAAYFVLHAIHGDRGLLARERTEAILIEARQALAEAEAERDALERRVAGLRGDRIARDTLEERARGLLNLYARDEVVIPYPQDGRLF
jgi:cell division protein FtsB